MLKVSGSGFNPNQTAVVRVALKKRSLQGFGRTISLLQASNDHLGIRASEESEEKKNQRVKVFAHAKSLPVYGLAHTWESSEKPNGAGKHVDLEIPDDQMGGSVSVAAAALLKRITPGSLLKKLRRPDPPRRVGSACTVYAMEGVFPSLTYVNEYPLLMPLARMLSRRHARVLMATQLLEPPSPRSIRAFEYPMLA
jgi:hypothetical protein